MRIKEFRIEAGETVDHSSNFEAFTTMTLKLQEVANFGMFHLL